MFFFWSRSFLAKAILCFLVLHENDTNEGEDTCDLRCNCTRIGLKKITMAEHCDRFGRENTYKNTSTNTQNGMNVARHALYRNASTMESEK